MTGDLTLDLLLAIEGGEDTTELRALAATAERDTYWARRAREHNYAKYGTPTRPAECHCHAARCYC